MGGSHCSPGAVRDWAESGVGLSGFLQQVTTCWCVPVPLWNPSKAQEPSLKVLDAVSMRFETRGFSSHHQVPCLGRKWCKLEDGAQFMRATLLTRYEVSQARPSSPATNDRSDWEAELPGCVLIFVGLRVSVIPLRAAEAGHPLLEFFVPWSSGPCSAIAVRLSQCDCAWIGGLLRQSFTQTSAPYPHLSTGC